MPSPHLPNSGPPSALSKEAATKLEVVFKYLANQTRVRIIHLLSQGRELSVSDIATQLDLSIQTVSNQLRFLESVRILESRRDGRQILYHTADAGIALLIDQAVAEKP